MRPDVLAALAAFERTAELRSITAAGHALNVTPAAVSQTIRKLERRLGVRLFDRTTRSVNLTEAGRAYWERVGPLLAGLRAATEDLQVQAGAEGGLLRLSVPHMAAVVLIEPLLGEFARAHPHVTLELNYDDRLVDIVKEGFDAGIRLGESLHGDMVATPLTHEFRLRFYAAPTYLAARGEPRTPGELAQHNCICFRMPTSGSLYRWEFLEEGRIVAMAVRGSLIVNHWRAQLEAAAQGVGISIGEADGAAPYVRDGRLVEVLAPFSPAFPGLSFYYPRREHLPAKTRVFLDFLRRRLAP